MFKIFKVGTRLALGWHLFLMFPLSQKDEIVIDCEKHQELSKPSWPPLIAGTVIVCACLFAFICSNTTLQHLMTACTVIAAVVVICDSFIENVDTSPSTSDVRMIDAEIGEFSFSFRKLCPKPEPVGMQHIRGLKIWTCTLRH